MSKPSTLEIVGRRPKWWIARANMRREGRRLHPLPRVDHSQIIGQRSGLDGWNRFWPFRGAVAAVVFIRSIGLIS
jgi:hypothetical protein